MTDSELRLKSVAYRRALLKLIHATGAGHTGGGLSCIDILNVLYNRILRVSPANFADPDRDRYVQSKGHSVEALYVVLSDCGFFCPEDLQTICGYKSPYVGHPTRKIPGIEMNTGALGHGLAICTGMALAGMRDGKAFRVFTLLGDGEMAEGSNWEAAMAAGHYRLSNLTAIVDHNCLQISGRTSEVCSNEPLDEKWRAFGWNVRAVGGHDVADLTRSLSQVPEPGKPTCLIANTTKGKGISFMENQAGWHHRVPDTRELANALAELDACEIRLAGGNA